MRLPKSGTRRTKSGTRQTKSDCFLSCHTLYFVSRNPKKRRKVSITETEQGSKSNLRYLDYSPTKNPLWSPTEVRIKAKTKRSNADVVSLETGEVTGCAVVRRVENVDDEQFVKVFSAGVAASFNLTKTAQRTFQAVL